MTFKAELAAGAQTWGWPSAARCAEDRAAAPSLAPSLARLSEADTPVLTKMRELHSWQRWAAFSPQPVFADSLNLRITSVLLHPTQSYNCRAGSCSP